MNRLKSCIILNVFVLSAVMLNGQNTYLNKKVNLPTGQVMLKTALKNLSNQTGCVFSYDPTKIVENQIINISIKGSLSLHLALLKILPKNILFKLNGKYIVLQEFNNKAVIKSQTAKLKQSGQIKLSSLNIKGKGTIDKNTNIERLVLPPLNNSPEDVKISQEVNTFPIIPGDSMNIAQRTLPILQNDSNVEIQTLNDTISKIQVHTSLLPLAEVIPSINNKVVTSSKNAKPGFNDFIKKNGCLEMGVSINNQLGALTLDAGLYNFYSIFSIGSDYNDSYLFGIGVGTVIKIDNHFSLNFDLLRNSLIAGKSYELKVRASNTQFIPVLNYSISSIRFFAGPTVNLIKSSYISSVSTTDLGVLVGLGFSAGIKIDLKKLLLK